MMMMVIDVIGGIGDGSLFKHLNWVVLVQARVEFGSDG